MSKIIHLDAEFIRKVLEEEKPASLTAIWRRMGGRGSVPGSTAQRMRVMVPGLAEALAANKGVPTAKSAPAGTATGKPDGAVPKAGRTKGAKIRISGTSKSKWPRSPSNPFREGSSYSVAFDVLAAHPDGLPKAQWAELYMKATKKDAQHARYDLQVLLSACDTPTGERHRSCRDGFYIQREGDHVRLRT